MCSYSSIQKLSLSCAFGDGRLSKRLAKVLFQMCAEPMSGVNSLSLCKHQKKAYYRFINNSKVYSENLMLGYQDCSVSAALLGSQVILALQDTTELDFTGNRSSPNLDCLEYEYKKGFYLHNHLLLNDLGVPYGLFSQQFYAYKLADLGKAKERKYADITEKHSHRWLQEFEMLQERFKTNTDKMVISIADRESDIHEVLQARRYAHIHYLIRSKRDRALSEPTASTDVHTIWEAVAGELPSFRYMLKTPTKKDRNQFRTAHISVRYTKVCIKPSYRKHRKLEPVDLWIVEASEVDTPVGEDAIGWRLLTSVPIESAEIAQKMITYYVMRWVIERFHYVLKQGCKVEALQIETPEALKNAITLHSWSALNVTNFAYQSNLMPLTPLIEMGYDEQDYSIAYKYVKHKINSQLVKVEKPTLLDFSTLIAQMGGSNLHKNRGLPVASLWKGWAKFLLIKEIWFLQKESVGVATPTLWIIQKTALLV
jgi:hypothetical protein